MGCLERRIVWDPHLRKWSSLNRFNQWVVSKDVLAGIEVPGRVFVIVLCLLPEIRVALSG